MATNRADSHDLDKLDRWRQGLEALEGADKSTFPVCAIFLVSGEDRQSHDIFRKYRDSFEDRKAGFHHLVIFGQHGISSTVTGFLAQINLAKESLPCLALATGPGAQEVHLYTLPPGGHPGLAPALEREHNLGEPWQLVLDQVEAAVDSGWPGACFPAAEGGRTLSLEGKNLLDLVKDLLEPH